MEDIEAGASIDRVTGVVRPIRSGLRKGQVRGLSKLWLW